MFRLLPPAGAPISISDIVRSVINRMQPGSGDRQLIDFVKNLSHQKHCFLVNSGKTALLLGLKALTRQADAFKNEVVIPAYTCFTVPAAVARGNLRVRPVDINPMTMDYDFGRLDAIDFTRVLAVLGNNLFGIPSNWNRLRELARDKNVYLIDDSAQAMGLLYNDKPLGSCGDLGFYSLGRGKNLSAYAGGVLTVSDDELARLIADEAENLSVSTAATEFAVLIKMVMLSLFLRPQFYRIPSMMPFLRLGETVFDTAFATARLSPLQTCLAATVSHHLRSYNQKRKDNSRGLAESIRSLPGFTVPGFNGSEIPAYLRLPILADDSPKRDRAVATLKHRGLSASLMYPSTIRQIAGIEEYLASPDDDFPGAQTVAERLFTLPTHPYVKQSDMDRMVSTLAGLHEE